MTDSLQINRPTRKSAHLASTLADWPELRWSEWETTISTLHLWTQVVGKIRLALATPINHWWHVTLYPTCRGLTTSPMPYGSRMVQIDFDFLDHLLIFQTSDGLRESLALKPMSVANFYAETMNRMTKLEMPVEIRSTPDELPNPIPFEEDERHAAYDAPSVARFGKVLLHTTRVFTEFRSGFIGKVSPVHFFWGGFDLSITRFSGRPAPKHPSVPYTPDHVVQEAYSHEVSSCGFWPGNATFPEPAFYSYAYPAPAGFQDAVVRPAETYFHSTLGEYILPYEAVRLAKNPDQTLIEFLQSTYNAAANLGKWNRQELEQMTNN